MKIYNYALTSNQIWQTYKGKTLEEIEQEATEHRIALTHYDYGFRIYNPAIGRFLSVDPLTASYPWYTPYQFAGNMPIWAIDLDGLEELIVTTSFEDGFDIELEVIHDDEVLSQVWESIQKPELKEKAAVFFVVGDHMRNGGIGQGHTNTLSGKTIEQYRYYLKNRNNPNLSPAWVDYGGKLEKRFEKYAINIELIREQILDGKSQIHFVALEGQQAMSGVDWNLESIVHEILIHLQEHIVDGKGDGDYGVEDHMTANDYEKLTEDQKKIIDSGSSISGSEAPEGSLARKIYDDVSNALDGGEYKKDYESKTKWVKKFYNERKKKDN
ncbi:RHS repeat domain-containing protein [Fulvivirga sediminis]|uniref:RHS repeat domain-containing protein n=1 Tax=Fulvivirga sediminis TaxID=2803949 RepID=UPI00293D9813|nr:RHS repeat-associated core domain-containing protein [Fulvivirga sediminis]